MVIEHLLIVFRYMEKNIKKTPTMPIRFHYDALIYLNMFAGHLVQMQTGFAMTPMARPP